jgi:hypothetical protein
MNLHCYENLKSYKWWSNSAVENASQELIKSMCQWNADNHGLTMCGKMLLLSTEGSGVNF